MEELAQQTVLLELFVRQLDRHFHFPLCFAWFNVRVGEIGLVP